VIDTTKTRSLFGPPRSLFGAQKRGPLFWAIFWLPKVKKAGPFFLQIGRSLFAQVPIFGHVLVMQAHQSADSQGLRHADDNGSYGSSVGIDFH
jgi:hypothetical protein